MRSQIVTILTIMFSFLSTAAVFGQRAGGPAPPEPALRPPGGPVPPELPIDDNLIILLFAGIVIGVWYFYKKRKTTNIPH
ncbi:hypothetical protein ACFQO1_00755 [Jejudonia soesokkakensis]|uniref:PEP-CTERM protein-sorting domain-containing protein n=1 Tax=Jejudonia soesokkakensis TaxID=1323432 RepID=A0ABW2MQU2_9FLAO